MGMFFEKMWRNYCFTWKKLLFPPPWFSIGRSARKCGTRRYAGQTRVLRTRGTQSSLEKPSTRRKTTGMWDTRYSVFDVPLAVNVSLRRVAAVGRCLWFEFVQLSWSLPACAPVFFFFYPRKEGQMSYGSCLFFCYAGRADKPHRPTERIRLLLLNKTPGRLKWRYRFRDSAKVGRSTRSAFPSSRTLFGKHPAGTLRFVYSRGKLFVSDETSWVIPRVIMS